MGGPQPEEKAQSLHPETRPKSPTQRYQLPKPIEGELLPLIIQELSFHSTSQLILAMRTMYINQKSLRTQLSRKTHGDIVELLVDKIERIAKYKIMCSVASYDLTKLDFTTYKGTTAFPDWWNLQWTNCLVQGTMQYGWANVPADYARDVHGFTKEWKGPKKSKKASKKEEKERLKLEALQKSMGNVSIESSMNAASGSASTSASSSTSNC